MIIRADLETIEKFIDNKIGDNQNQIKDFDKKIKILDEKLNKIYQEIQSLKSAKS